MFPSFQLFGKEISMYMVMTVLGALAMGLVLYFTTKKPGYRRDQIFHILIAGAGGAFVGAHLLFFFTRLPALWQLVTHWDTYIHGFRDIWTAVQILFGGMVFYGGLFGAIVGGMWYCKCLKIDGRLHLDAIVPTIPLFHMFGRLGCLLAGCCYGVESAYGWYFPHSPLADPLVRYFPIQLVEACFNLLLFILLFFLQKASVPKGKMLWIYFPLYAAGRFTLEFWRGDAVRGVYAGLSTSQWISLALLIASGVVWLREWLHNRRMTPAPDSTAEPAT